MDRRSRIYKVRTRNITLQEQLGTNAIYYTWSYTGSFNEIHVCIFCIETGKYLLLDITNSKNEFEYYVHEPLTKQESREIITKFNELTDYTIQ